MQLLKLFKCFFIPEVACSHHARASCSWALAAPISAGCCHFGQGSVHLFMIDMTEVTQLRNSVMLWCHVPTQTFPSPQSQLGRHHLFLRHFLPNLNLFMLLYSSPLFLVTQTFIHLRPITPTFMVPWSLCHTCETCEFYLHLQDEEPG